MIHASSLILTLALLQATAPATAVSRPDRTIAHPLLRLSLINMSGKSRQAHLRNAIVALPLAQPVVLQVVPGESIRITSDTDRKLQRTLTVAPSDQGRLIPVS